MDSSDVLSSCLVYFIIVPVYVTMFRWILATGVIACFDMSEQLCVSCWDKWQAMEKARTTEAVGGEKKQKVGMTSGDERKTPNWVTTSCPAHTPILAVLKTR